MIRPILPDMRLVEEHLRESFATHRMSNFGPAARRLTTALVKRKFLTGGVVLTSSGHTALMAATATAHVRRWAIPAYTFESTRVAVHGSEITYVDVDEHGCLSADALRAADFDGVMVVCPLSTVPDIAEIIAIAGNRPVVVDGAPTFGTPIMTTAPTCVSFHATKTFPMGEGGAIYNLDEARVAVISRHINFGLAADGEPAGDGLNAKMSEYTAAVGLALLEQIDQEITARLRNAAIYRSRLSDLIPKSIVGGKTVYAIMPVFMPTKTSAEMVRRDLVNAGVGHGRYYRPLVPLPGAVRCYDRNLSLPVHGDVEAGTVDVICDIVTKHT